MSTPVSSIAFCSGVGLNSRYEHTYYFNTIGEQRTFFNSKAVKGVVPATYLRKRMNIRVPIPFETACKYDYCYFRNNDDKVWYYFIEDHEYINDNTTEIKIELDVMQTYMFDYELLPCFVEREHIKKDEIFANRMDEGIDVGDYRTIQSVNVDLSELVILMATTFKPDAPDSNLEDLDTTYQGVWSGLIITAVTKAKWRLLNTYLQSWDEKGISNGVVAMWLYPKNLVKLRAITDNDVFMEVEGIEEHFKSLTPVWALNGYTPHNNKLLGYPYNMLYVTNNAGSAATYMLDHFGDRWNPNFKFVGTLTPDAAVKMYPLNYMGDQHAYDHGLVMDNFPQCAWTQDVYKLWLAQNQSQQAVATGGAALQIVAGVGMAAATIASGGTTAAVLGTGAVANIASGLSSITNLIAQKADREIQPPQSKGVQNSNVNIVAGFQTFTIKQKTITSQYAERIDAFFDKYGYKTAMIKVPNRNVRTYWTYTKTNGCKIKGSFATADMRAIETIYDNGITFWKSTRTIGDYSNPDKNKALG